MLPEFLHNAFPRGEDIPLEDLLLRFALAVALGCVVGLIYRLTHRGDSPAAPSFIVTLVLLCVLIAMVTQVVGESIGRAFTLVGALSIVRFRTVVEDTRDTAFVIFAVAAGMAAGMGNLKVALVGFGVVGSTAILLMVLQRYTFKPDIDWNLQLRVSAGAGSETPWEGIFTKLCDSAELQSTATARQGAAVDLVYKLRLRPGVTPLQLLNDINRLEGIQNLELKRI